MTQSSRPWCVLPGPDGGVLDYREGPVAAPTPGHILVRTHAAGVNRGELIGRPASVSTTLPLVLRHRETNSRVRSRRFGATDVIDTTQSDWPAQVRVRSGEGVQAVIDQGGGSLFPGLLSTMALRGRYVSVGRNDDSRAEIDLDLVALKRLHLIGATFRTRSLEEALRYSERCAADLSAAIHQGALRPALDRVFSLDALPEVHTYMLTNQQIGKIMLHTNNTAQPREPKN